MAVKHHYTSVLEHHHASVAWTLLQDEELGILSALAAAEQQVLQATLFQCLLATDHARHNALLAQLPQLAKTDTLDQLPTRSGQRQLVLACLLHSADLCEAFKPDAVAIPWMKRLHNELNDQAQLEAALGLAPLPLPRGAAAQDVHAWLRRGLVNKVARPWFDNLALVFPNLRPLVQLLHDVKEE
eukprot:m.135839 g.135839  ORF g.135839 m.135839 type:complete len:185 (-) comp16007_c0_seq7:89-643(-)